MINGRYLTPRSSRIVAMCRLSMLDGGEMLSQSEWKNYFSTYSYLIRSIFFLHAKTSAQCQGMAWGRNRQSNWRQNKTRDENLDSSSWPILQLYSCTYKDASSHRVSECHKHLRTFLPIEQLREDALSSQPSPLPPSPARFAQPSNSICLRLDGLQSACGSVCRLCFLHQSAPGDYFCK